MEMFLRYLSILEKGMVYAKCIKCGYPPERVYIDVDGVQVTYEAKLLNDIKELMHQLIKEYIAWK